MIVLASHAEQVTLVVVPDFTIRACPKQAIAVAAIGRLDDHAASDHRIELLRLATQPLAGRTILRFR